MTVKKYGISQRQRIRDTADFARVYETKQRASNRFLLIFAAKNNLGFTRFGLSVSKKHGNAVKRSHLKRLLREAFRLSQNELPLGLDLILIPQKGADAELIDFQNSLIKAVEKLAQRLQVEDER